MLDPLCTGPIDLHAHAFTDELAERVRPQMEAICGFKPHYDATLSGLRAAMAASGVKHAVVQPVATKPSQVATINRWCLEVEAWPGLSAFGSLHPDLPADAVSEQIHFLSTHHIRGVKLHPEYQNFYPDEDRLAFIYHALEDAGLVLLLHSGEDAAYHPPFKATPRRVRQIVEGFPRLRVIAAHMGGFRMWPEVERELIGRPIGLDTAYCVGQCPQGWFREMVAAHGPDRIYFASDGPWGSQPDHLKYLRTAGVTDSALEQIAWKNALALLQRPSLNRQPGVPPRL